MYVIRECNAVLTVVGSFTCNDLPLDLRILLTRDTVYNANYSILLLEKQR